MEEATTKITEVQSYVCKQSIELNDKPENMGLIVFTLVSLGVSLHFTLVTLIYCVTSAMI
jgi:hypothetical protein